MPHEGGLERDGADPLAPGLDQVLRSILDVDRRAFVDRHNVARLEPPIVGEPIAAVVAVVVRRGDPWTANLELAHGLAIPSDEAVAVPCPDLDKGRRAPLFRPLL